MDATRQVRWLSLMFLGFLVAPALELAGRDLPWYGTVATAAGLAAVGALFVQVVWSHLDRPHSGRAPLALAGLVACALAVQLALGRTWLLTWAYVVASLVVLALPRRWWAPGLLGLSLAVAAVGRWRLDQGTGTTLAVAAGVLGYGVLVGLFYWVVDVAGQLRAARAELARAAVSAERLRIARDLHDVLGQRLTEVVLRAELSARLVSRDPERAAAEMVSVGTTGRSLLAEVRSVVSGYREVSVDNELATAREVTRAAGVALTVDVPDPAPAGADSTALAWVIREGVTNVLRHASATTCTISVRPGDPVVVTIADDGPEQATGEAGRTGRSGGEVSFGTGLSGLAERVAAAGGRLTTLADDSSFTLRAEIPDAAGRTR